MLMTDGGLTGANPLDITQSGHEPNLRPEYAHFLACLSTHYPTPFDDSLPGQLITVLEVAATAAL